MEDKVLAFYVDDVLIQQYFLIAGEVSYIDFVNKGCPETVKVELSKAIDNIQRTIKKMKFKHISIWLKPIK